MTWSCNTKTWIPWKRKRFHSSIKLKMPQCMSTNKKFKMIYFQTIIDFLLITFFYLLFSSFIFKIHQLLKIVEWTTKILWLWAMDGCLGIESTKKNTLTPEFIWYLARQWFNFHGPLSLRTQDITVAELPPTKKLLRTKISACVNPPSTISNPASSAALSHLA